GQVARDGVDVAIEAQRGQQLERFVDGLLLFGHGAEPVAIEAVAFADGQHDGLQHRKPLEQGVDLESARHAHLDALVLRTRRDVLVTKKHLARRGLQGARKQVDEGGLARAVGADQCVTAAGFEGERYVAVCLEGAPLLGNAFGTESGIHARPPAFVARARRRSRQASTAPRMPPRPTMTMMTRNSPIQNCQYTGLTFAIWSCAIMNTSAPISAPYRRPVPPSTRMMSRSAERMKPRESRPTNWVV